jgi:hypothetical protein
MQVWAKNEEIRKILKHPIAGGFGPDLSHPTEWPDDQFTTRRLRDGDISLSAPGTQAKTESAAQQKK